MKMNICSINGSWKVFVEVQGRPGDYQEMKADSMNRIEINTEPGRGEFMVSFVKDEDPASAVGQ